MTTNNDAIALLREFTESEFWHAAKEADYEDQPIEFGWLEDFVARATALIDAQNNDGQPETDPENIYGSATIQQSIEEDRK